MPPAAEGYTSVEIVVQPASVPCNLGGGGILFIQVWYSMLQKWVVRGGDFELTCSSLNGNYLFHFSRFFSCVLSMQTHRLASELLMSIIPNYSMVALRHVAEDSDTVGRGLCCQFSVDSLGSECPLPL